MSVEEDLDTSPHRPRHLKLGETDEPDTSPHRPPRLTVWPSMEEGQVVVTFSMAAMWGQPLRFADLSPAEARQFAAMLNAVADDAERIGSSVTVLAERIKQAAR